MANKDFVGSVRFATSNLRTLTALAKVENTSAGELIRTAVKEFIDKKLSDPKTHEAIEKAKKDFNSMMESLLNPVSQEE